MKPNPKSLCLAALLVLGLVSQAQAQPLIESSPLWLRDGVLTDHGQQLIALLNDPTPLGLQPLSLPAKTDSFTDGRVSNAILEQQFIDLATALGRGLTTADNDNEWHIPKDDFLASALLEDLRNGRTLATVINSVVPTSYEYSRLVSAFLHYQSIERAGGWPMLPESDRILRPGERHVDVKVLRDRLRIEGDFAGGMQADPFYFGPSLAKAVRQYQTRHGLLADGVLDSQTRHELRAPASERLQKIQVNLERWRWMPRTLAKRRLWVNTAGAFAQLIDDSGIQLQLRAIAGRPYRATPSLVSSIESLVVNPAWGVPHRIAVQDLLPLQKKNKQFFAQKSIRVFSHKNGKSVEVERNSIDWSATSAENFPYQLRQDPGQQNSMGRIKFVFANKFNVFLHDTPNKALFELPNRNFSSGCVRIENPFQLANAVLADSPHNVEKLQQLRKPVNPRSQSLTLERSLPIYLVYMTAWHDDQGLLHFAADHYDRDRIIAGRLPQTQSSQLAAADSPR